MERSRSRWGPEKKWSILTPTWRASAIESNHDGGEFQTPGSVSTCVRVRANARTRAG
jgi:hypothetical protein